MKTLDELGYDVANSESTGADDLKSSMAVISDPSTVNVSSLLVFAATYV
jgi:archaellum component FlaG (FlaF/FlaG flagellin family)